MTTTAASRREGYKRKGRADSAPAPGYPSHQPDTSASTAQCKTPPPRSCGTRQVVPSIDVSHTGGSDLARDRMGDFRRFARDRSAEVGMLLVPAVVVPHP